jgi:hypothetical protein
MKGMARAIKRFAHRSGCIVIERCTWKKRKKIGHISDNPWDFASQVVHGCLHANVPSIVKVPSAFPVAQPREPKSVSAHYHFWRERAGNEVEGRKTARVDEYRRYAVECIRSSAKPRPER